MDSNFVGDLDKRRSLTSYIFIVFRCTISWKVTLKSIVVMSTTKAKYMALTKAITEHQDVLDSFGLNQQVPVVFCASQSIIHLVKNPVYHERTKHIDVKLHFINKVLVMAHLQFRS